MTELFTPQQRQDVYDTLLNQFKNDDRITGILSLGAADTAFADDNSGITLLIIIEKPSIIDIVFTLWVKRLEKLFNSQTSFSFIINDNLNNLSILLDNYLQISFQFRAVNRFHLVGTDWCVVFDRHEYVRNYLGKRTKTREQHVKTLYKTHMGMIWNPIVSCVRELRRRNLWKAVAELEILRKHMVEIAGLRHLEFTQDYVNMKSLPEMFLDQLRHTLPTSISETAIRRSLKITLSMLFAETAILDEQCDTSYTQQLERRLSDFVELYS
jgi:hypothetical protein